jgi:membrane protein
VNVFERLEAGFDRRVSAVRRRSRRFDHFWRTLTRYNDVLAGRLAAAIAYYGFFAVFAFGLVAYWIFAAILEDNKRVSDAVAQFLTRNLPFLDPVQIQQSSGRVGVIGLVLLAFTGVGWVEAIRSSQRLIYGLNQQPGYVVIRQLLDVLVLIVVFVLLGVSVGAVDVLESLLGWLLGTRSLGSSISSWILSGLLNMVLAAALLVVVPRLRITFRRLMPSVLLVGLGITLLNTAGRYYVMRWERNPAYTVVAGAVGLLLYLYLLNRLLLFGAAMAATSRHGRVVDLAERQKADDVS